MFDKKPEDRIHEFRWWRLALPAQDEQLFAKKVVDFWSKAPLTNQYYSADYDKNWPDPWQLIADGVYDDVSIGLAMFYSIALCEDLCYNVELAVCNTPNDKKLCAVINNSLFLNYYWGQIVNKERIKHEVNIEKIYSKKDFDYLN